MRVAEVFRHEQKHIFYFWPELPTRQRTHLLSQVSKIDFCQLKKLVNDNLAGRSRVITSSVNNKETRHSFEDRNSIGLGGKDIVFFRQVSLPMVERNKRLTLEKRTVLHESEWTR